MDSNTIFLFGAGASKQAGIPIGDEITNMLLNYSSYCPSESGIAIENLFRYLQAKIANYLEVKSTEINYELIIGALADLSNREDNITVPFHMKNIKKTGWDGYPHPSFDPFFTKYPA